MKKDKEVGSKVEDDSDEVESTMIITDGPKVYRLGGDEIGPRLTRLCRQQTGFPVKTFMAAFDQDSAVVIIWLARVASGEGDLDYVTVENYYENNPKAFQKLKVEIVTDDDEDEDPLDEEPSESSSPS